MHDRFRKRYQVPQASSRVRQQIAVEAARRMFAALAPRDPGDPSELPEPSEGEYYAAKRKAAAVLGHRIRPGDLPSNSEVRQCVVALAKSGTEPSLDSPADEAPDRAVGRLADHLDRFAVYKMRLEPLQAVKQNPRHHPEGDALFHSLQVFELAREARPYDEEFLLAALLHDVGKAIEPVDPVAAGVEALRGAVTERTLRLIEHHVDPTSPRDARARKPLESQEDLEDLELLRELDEAGRVQGAPVGTVDQALDYLRGLEREEYLES
jgi:hypothetical protein